MNRWQAFGIHLVASVAVFVTLLTVILTLWYHGILFTIDGGMTGLQLVIGVDVILGPLLTLIVFSPGKPSLKFDMTCILTLQIGCLLAGTWIVYSERPLALVLAFDTFYSLGAQEFEDFDRDVAVLDNFSGSYPKLLHVELPMDEDEANLLYFSSQVTADPLFMQVDRFRELPENVAQAFRREGIVRQRSGLDLQAYPSTECLFARFLSGLNQGYVCFDPATRQIDHFFADPASTGPTEEQSD